MSASLVLIQEDLVAVVPRAKSCGIGRAVDHHGRRVHGGGEVGGSGVGGYEHLDLGQESGVFEDAGGNFWRGDSEALRTLARAPDNGNPTRPEKGD